MSVIIGLRRESRFRCQTALRWPFTDRVAVIRFFAEHAVGLFADRPCRVARGARLAEQQGGDLWYTSDDLATLEYLETFRQTRGLAVVH